MPSHDELAQRLEERRAECVTAAGFVKAEWDAEAAGLSINEHVDRLMTEGANRDDITNIVRAHRGLPPLTHDAKSA